MLILWPLSRSNSGTSSINASFAEIVLNTTISALCAAPPASLMTTAPIAAHPEKRILASGAVYVQRIPSSGSSPGSTVRECAPPVPQAEAPGVALALGLGRTREGRAPGAEPLTDQNLDLPALEEELAIELGCLHDLIQRLQGRFALGVERHRGERMAVSHLIARQSSGQPLPVVLEQGMAQDLGIIGRVFALPVEEERLVEAPQQPRMARQHFVVRGIKAHDMADAALQRGAQAEQRYVVRRAEVVAVVGMKALFRVGDVRAHSVSRRAAEVAHVVDHLAVPALRHRSREQLHQHPVERLRLIETAVLERHPVDQRETDATFEQAFRPGHELAAGGKLGSIRLDHHSRTRVLADSTER